MNCILMNNILTYCQMINLNVKQSFNLHSECIIAKVSVCLLGEMLWNVVSFHVKGQYEISFIFCQKNLWTFHKAVILFLSSLLRSTENGTCNATWDTSIYTHGRYIICETSSRKLSGLIGKIKLSIREMNHIWQILNDGLEEVIVHELHFRFKFLLTSQL